MLQTPAPWNSCRVSPELRTSPLITRHVAERPDLSRQLWLKVQNSDCADLSSVHVYVALFVARAVQCLQSDNSISETDDLHRIAFAEDDVLTQREKEIRQSIHSMVDLLMQIDWYSQVVLNEYISLLKRRKADQEPKEQEQYDHPILTASAATSERCARLVSAADARVQPHRSETEDPDQDGGWPAEYE